MKTYQQYKESGIEWIGKIPESWEVKKIKKILNYEQPTEFIEEEIFENKEENFIPILTANKSFILGYGKNNNPYKNFPVIIFDDFTTDKKLVEFEFKVKSSAIKILKQKNKEMNLKYIFNTLNFVKVCIDEHKRYYISKFSQIKIPVPPIKTQKTIADYLDNKTSKIDKIITNKKKQVLLLEEYKKSLINKIVTKGINETEFKESGIEWIGKIPKDWEVKKIKYILNYEQPTEFIEEEIFENKEENFVPILTANKSFILGYGKNKNSYKNFPVIIFDDFTTDKKFVDFEFKVKSSAIKILKQKNKEVNIKYIFNTINFVNICIDEHKRYYISKFSQNKITFPPPKTQKTIADYLDNKTSKIDKIITNKKKQVLLLEEYKKSLINSVVLGRICVE